MWMFLFKQSCSGTSQNHVLQSKTIHTDIPEICKCFLSRPPQKWSALLSLKGPYVSHSGCLTRSSCEMLLLTVATLSGNSGCYSLQLEEVFDYQDMTCNTLPFERS